MYTARRRSPIPRERRFCGEMLELPGDGGARHLIGEHAELVTEIAAEDGGIFLDIDTPEAYRTLKDKSGE